MLRLAQRGTIPKVVCDQYGSPTWSRMIAEATAQVASNILNTTDRNRWGVYHLAAGGSTNWHEFATEIFRWANKQYGLNNSDPIAIPSSEYPTKVKRPEHSCLSIDKIAHTFRIRLPDWDEQFGLMACDG